MIIAIDIRTLLDAQYSGVPEYAFQLVKAILKQDKINQYKLFYNSFKIPNKRLFELEQENAELIGWHWPNKILNFGLLKPFNFPHIDQKLKADLFFAPHLNFFGLSNKTCSIITVHDLSFLRYKEFFSYRRNLWHRLINVKKLLKKFDQIVAVSENTKQDIIELCEVDEKKIKVIYSGIDPLFQTSNFKFQTSNLITNKYKLPEKFILYLGTLEPRKNICGLIEAYNLMRQKNPDLKDYKLVLAGAWGWKSEGIKKSLEKSPYKNDILVLGYVEHKDKNEIYRLASVFVYPSFYEGFGLPILEAMACGAPVITSFNSSLSEVTGDAALLIDPFNSEMMALALEQTLINKSLHQELIKKGFAQVKNFSWEKTAGEYLKLFKNRE